MTIKEKIELSKTSTSSEILDKLSYDKDEDIRWNIACNKKMSPNEWMG